MALRNIVIEGDDILRKKARPVDKVNDHIREILDDMVETMRQERGVGLAGPQVGILRRLFVAEPEPERVYYMVNPEILERKGSEIADEGCLSVPGLIGTVERPAFIRLQALDRDGKKQTYEFSGFDARVMCHEYDHLDGILYTDKATDIREPSVMQEEAQETELREEKNEGKE